MDFAKTPVGMGLKLPAPGVEQQKKSGAATAAERDQKKLKSTCQDFESVFLNYMLSKMRDTVPKSDLMGADRGEDIYRGMLDEELSKQMAASGGMGLADILYRQLAGQSPKKVADGQAPPDPHRIARTGLPAAPKAEAEE